MLFQVKLKVGLGGDYSKKARTLETNCKKKKKKRKERNELLKVICILLTWGLGRGFSGGFPYSDFCPWQ